MTQPSLPTRNSGLRVFSAALLSALLIMMPFVQLAAASRRGSGVGSQGLESGRRAANNGQQDRATNAARESIFANAPIPKSAPEPATLLPTIVATKDDGLATATTVAPGGTINYSVNIKNNGTLPADDATGVVFTDIIDAHTTLVVNSAVAAVSDRYNAIGNVQLSIPDGATDLLANDIDPDTGNNSGMTVTAETKSSTQCAGCNNVTISADGSFTYNPPVGFSGTDTFTYTAHSTLGPGTATETVTITVANEIWFINNNAGACPGPPCDGRLTHPFTSLANFNAANLGGAGQPGDNDWIFVYENATLDYTGPATLRLGQKFIGQDATASLASLTGFPAASGTDQLPAMNSGNGAFVDVSGTNVTGINLNSGNTLRGFRVTDVGLNGTKISGTTFGTLVVGNSGSPDVLLSGTGRALNLTTGTLSTSGGFISVATTSSATQGISLSGVTDSDGAGAGAFSFGSTTVSGSTTQGILIGTTPADLNFGATSVTGGTVGVSLQNNAGGTRTFGTLGISGSANEAFLHAVGGGNVTVTGAATLSSAGSAISVSAPALNNAINFQAATSATTTAVGITAVNWVGAANTSMTFNSLSITRNNATALNASGAGTINVTNATGSITNTTPGGPAIIAANIALNANFSQINSTAGANGVSLTGVTGTSNFGTGQLTGTASGVTFVVNGGTASVTYSGNITQAAAAPMVSIIDHGTGTILFQTGTLNATSGTGISLDNADGIYNFSGTNTLNGGNAHIDIIDGSGGAISFGSSTTITNPSGVAVNVDGSGVLNPVTAGITIAGSISKTSGGRLIDFNEYDTGTANISATLSCTTSCGGIEVTNDGGPNSGILNFTAATKTLNTGGNTAVNLDNNDSGQVNFTGGGLDIDTTSGSGFSATNGGTVTVTTGANPNTIDSTTNTALNVSDTNIGAGGLTFRSINSGTSTGNGIILSTTGASGGLTVTGNGGTCTSADQSGCSGGTIANKTGGDGSTTQGSGIYLNSTSNVSLTRMFLHDFQNFAIRGTTVTGFTFANSLINGTNGTNVGFDEGCVSFTNLTGVAAITSVNLSGGVEDNFRVVNSTGSLNRITFDGVTIGANSTALGDNGLFLQAQSGSTLNATIQNSFLTSARGDLFQFDVTGTGIADLIVTGTAFSNNHPAVVVGGGGVTVSGGGVGSNINFTYDFNGNTFQGARGDGILSAMQLASNGTMSGRIRNNTLGVVGVDRSASLEAQAIEVRLVGGGTQSITLHNNTVRNYNSNGILLEAGDNQSGGNGTFNATVTSNNVTPSGATLSGLSQSGIHVNFGTLDVPADTHQGCFDIRTNTATGAGRNGGADIRIRHRQSTTLRLPGYTNTQYNTAAVQTFITTNLNLGSVTASTSSAGGGFQNTAGGAPCATLSASNLIPELPSHLQPANTNQQYSASATNSENNATVTTTASPRQLSTFASAFTSLAVETGSQISPNALTHSAELSSQRSDVSEQKSEIRTHHAASSKLETRNTRSDEETGLRAHYAPLSKLATRSATAAPAPMSGETVTANIGALPAGGSVTISFQVTVNNPPNLTLLGPPRVENQGTVSGNFTSVLTDDPNVGGAADKTVTLIDLFDTTVSLVSDLNPSNDADLVTFTATINETPVQGGVDPTGTVDFIDTSNGNAVICNDVPVSASAAQCQTSTLSAGSTHNIRADYSGDGNFDPSQSNLVAQVVNACTINPVVTKVADTNDGVCDGDCSLREAIATVCSAPNNNITFDTAGVFATPQTITLTLGELAVGKNLTINAPDAAANHVTVSGGGVTRVFNINSGKTATISGLTITGGTASVNGAVRTDGGTVTLINSTVSGNLGGGIFTDVSGSVTVVNSTISGNSAAGGGAGIYCDNNSTLNVTNSTISGNTTPGSGGGIAVYNGCTATITNATITNNFADDDNALGGTGGGIFIGSGPIVTLRNSIVALNFNEDGGTDAADDIDGALVTGPGNSTNNLVGTCASCGLTDGVDNNELGVTAAELVLGTLQNNGGTTSTHALGAGSIAIETGNNGYVTAPPFLNMTPINDQRGTGFPRIADSADADATQTVDIGAYEAHPTLENITDKTTAEDTPFNFNFNLGDDTGALIATVTATSSNQTLVPDANLLLTGSGGARNLAITPAADANSPADGTATITVTVTATNGRTAVDTFVVTVTEVNDNPDAINDTLTAVDEDSGLRVIPFGDLTGNDTKGPANESAQTLTVTNVSNPTGGTVAINGTNVEFTLAANFSGTASFDYTITDDGTTNTVPDPKSDTATASFTVNTINDPPSFTIAADPPAVNEDAGAQTVNSFATSISQGAGGETGQTLTFNITPTGTTGNLSFASGPVIDTSTGNLTYTTNADTNGTASFSVTLSDNGSNTPPNSNTSGAQTFTITVNAVDDAPTFTLAAGPTVAEDAGAQSVPSFASNFQPGPVTATDESTQTLVGYTLTQTGSTGGLTFSGTPAIDTAGTLTYTATGDTSGTATFDVVATDTGSNTPPNVNQSAPQSFTITVNAANDAPVNTVPGPQGTASNTPLTFSSGNGNQISVADADAGASPIKVTLTVTNGTLTLNGTTGLDFTGTCSGAAGDGTADATMTFCGSLTDVNNALNGMTYTPTAAFSGPATLTITSNDLGNTGTGGALSDTDVVNIQVATEIRINDASASEPVSPNTVDMVFTVSLNSPAPAGGVSVNFTTQNEPAGAGKAVAGTCGNPGADYVTTNGTVNFAAGEQVKTINVPICSDAVAEPDETFKVLLSGESGATLIDGDATGTIKSANTAGAVLISELRTSGPGGAGDDFVEIYNNSDAPLTVAASDASAGYGLYKMGADCNATPVLIGVIPNGTVIPARGHYLFVGSAYSLTNYGGTGAAAGNLTMSSDIENDRNVGLFSTSNVGGISSVNRLDAVGFGVNVGGACNLLREGSTLGATSGSTTEHSFFRKLCEPGVSCTGTPKDTNDNQADFMFADTQGSIISGIPQKLGAPGPENISSPIKRDPQVLGVFLDSTKPSSAVPNRSRDFTSDAPNNSTFGTMTIRRRIVNNTGVPVTRLRFRIIDMTTFPSAPGTADLRARTGVNESVGPVNDAATCTASGAGAPPCTVNVQATTLEAPPAQPNGGGMNSSMSSGTITLGSPLAHGASINVNFLLGIQQTGTFRFFIIIEALP